jgi:chitin synthase
MAKAFESLFGSVTCLPGCFCMYRLRTPKKVPLLIANQILNEYKDTNVNTLHKQNLLSLGEDRFLTTLMLKHFPEYRNKFTPDAVCYTIVPDSFQMLLGQRRRWINSTIHNLFELVFLPTLCGCLCFSMRLVVFLDLFATLIMPAATAYLGYLIYASIDAQQAPMISLIMMSAAYGLQTLIFLIKHQYQHIGWMIISIFALPVFSFYIPLYAYWHFDDFKWGNTRKGAAADTGHGGGSHGGVDPELEYFDASIIPLMKWDEYESFIAKNAALTQGYSMDSTVVSSKDQSSVRSQTELNQSYNHTMDEARATEQNVNQVQQVVYRGVSVNDNQQSYIHPWRGGYPFDSEIEGFVRFIIHNSDLSQLSKKKVRESANAYFGCDLIEKKNFINQQVEIIIESL